MREITLRRRRRQATVLAAVTTLALLLSFAPLASGFTPVELKVTAENADGKLDLKVTGTAIDAPGGNGNLAGSGEFKTAIGETTLNIDKSEIIGTETTFYMIQLTDTSKSGSAPAKVQIRLMPSEGGSANIRVRDATGNLLVQFDSGAYTIKLRLE